LRIPIKLIVASSHPDTIPPQYFGTSDEVLNRCRDFIGKGEIYTCNPTIVHAFQHLHRIGEVELSIDRLGVAYDIDIKGDFINPWPDQFFELNFYLIFGGYLK
jgi:hypothetical protein